MISLNRRMESGFPESIFEGGSGSQNVFFEGF